MRAGPPPPLRAPSPAPRVTAANATSAGRGAPPPPTTRSSRRPSRLRPPRHRPPDAAADRGRRQGRRIDRGDGVWGRRSSESPRRSGVRVGHTSRYFFAEPRPRAVDSGVRRGASRRVSTPRARRGLHPHAPGGHHAAAAKSGFGRAMPAIPTSTGIVLFPALINWLLARQSAAVSAMLLRLGQLLHESPAGARGFDRSRPPDRLHDCAAATRALPRRQLLVEPRHLRRPRHRRLDPRGARDIGGRHRARRRHDPRPAARSHDPAGDRRDLPPAPPAGGRVGRRARAAAPAERRPRVPADVVAAAPLGHAARDPLDLQRRGRRRASPSRRAR